MAVHCPSSAGRELAAYAQMLQKVASLSLLLSPKSTHMLLETSIVLHTSSHFLKKSPDAKGASLHQVLDAWMS